MILSSQTIKILCKPIEYQQPFRQIPLIAPFSEASVHSGMTFGLSACGYDIRIDQNVTLYPISLRYMTMKALGLARPSFILASSYEKFSMPNDLAGLVMDKSTWARRGLAVQNTIIEPGWGGWLTLELSNHGDSVLKIAKGAPVAQVVFYELDKSTDLPYKGKYSDQKRGPQRAILS